MLVNYRICDTFSTEKRHLGLAGFYPGIYNMYQTTINIFCVLIETGQLIFTLAFVAVHWSNMIKLSETLLFSMTQIAFLSKLFNYMIKKQNCVKIELMLSDPLFTDITADQRYIFNNNISSVNRVAYIYRILCFFAVLLYGLFPFLDTAAEEKVYPIPCLFPFNPDNYYTPVYLAEILSIAIGAWLNSTIDIFFCIMITVGKSQFEILSNKIGETTHHIENHSLTEKLLKSCIKYHQGLLRYNTLVETTFSDGIFVQFLCSVAVICLTGFQMLIIEIQSVQFFLLLVYFSCMMFQVAIYCWYGQLLMEKSDAVTSACYEIDWHRASTKNQKMLITIMERVKKPVIMRAFGFFELNLATLMKILKSSYSYFAVLQHLYTTNNK
ncbi:odorant receptor 85b-like [Rhynchophorus ferrugineus]|uniref:odorant receptor 85b-like n=1 Tax=Rhynchophorus ferrugineus TaxID=354439 RepID=UPI003FCDD90F